ncbi:tryptophan synthase subunit alpha [Staphylococcus sp. NRL 16/872]|uniref:tryptophan synthase subunit alpha n=1 Tax=Staphylococcus sp. NRL 16/872 TaxID=2930131 RepID=UPI001FB41A84|nr:MULTISPECIES: tryptophan synthase subunit alpha [unclassified Staphylococcus]MCJ1656405.1 tryptophan synthase subunit alpha [Staphylococcus sp. NRL 21/187]MCJ1662170.1 tryptophan synthase subunit alpha [Staphylococcus sp. NRL 18/288]WEN68438.1 tryptophan synthase subunit alpha [Staphylococcus sp. NRL 16/872]
MSKLFIPYVMGNKDFIKNIKVLDENGADIIEIGVPFSDPVADGPVIMDAGNKAIKEGITIDFIFNELVSHQHEINCKYVLMTYYNIIVSYGEEAFFKECEKVGVYGVIIPDLPFELAEALKRRVSQYSVKIISLIAMTASEERIKMIAQHAEGFIYTVTMNATTGEDGTFHPELKEKLKRIKELTDIPVVAGFGIRTPEHVSNIIEVADGVVIGSEIVSRFENEHPFEMGKYLVSIKEALNK